MKQLVNKILWVALLGSPLSSPAATDFFTFDGTLMNAGVPMTPSQNLIFKIYDPSANCLLYEETHNAVPVQAVSGAFNVKIGTGLRTGSDPGLAFGSIFKNSAALVGAASCNYSPLATDARVLRVTVGATTLSPDYVVSSVPMAKVAESLDGIPSNQILLQSGSHLNQANLANIFSATNYPKLSSLLSGNSTSTINMGGSNTITGLAAPSASSDAATKGYSDSYVAGHAVDSALNSFGGGDANKVMTWDGIQWTAVPASTLATDSSKLPLSGGTLSGALNMNANDIWWAGNITMSAQTNIHIGAYTNGQESGLVSGWSAPDAGKLWYNTNSSQLKYWDGTAVQSLSSGGGGSVSAIYAGTGLTGGPITSSGTLSIAPDGVSSAEILDGSIVSADIAANALNPTNKIFTNPGANHLVATDGTTGSALAPFSCAIGETLQWTVTGWSCVPFFSLGAGSVGTAEIANSTIQLVDLASNSVDGTKIVDNSVSSADILNVDIDKISSGSGKYLAYMPNNIPCTTGQILSWDGTNTRWSCAANAVTTAITALTGDVISSGPGASAATIANSSITSAKILDGTISPTDLSAAVNNGLWSGNGTDVSRATGNVGIGTSTPGANLEVNGSTKLIGTLNFPPNVGTYQNSGGTCSPTTYCMQHTNNAIVLTFSPTLSGVSQNLTCLSTGMYNGQLLIVLMNNSAAYSTNLSNGGTCSGGYGPIVWNSNITPSAVLASTGKGNYQFIWDNTSGAWRLISAM